MIVEVTGCGAANKGAELMLVAIQQHFRAISGGVKLAVERWFGSYEERTSYGLYHKLSATKFGRSALAIRLMPESFRRAYGLVAEADIDAVLDASGFAFGDQHGPEPCERMAEKMRRWKRQGKPVVLLPQAFGPFSSTRIQDSFRQVVALADLVFARDPESLEHVQALSPGNDRVKLAPDFTCLVAAKAPSQPLPPGRLGVLVPNRRMLEKTAAETAARYVTFMSDCVAALSRCGLEPLLLIHDTGDDRALAEQIARESGRAVPIIEEPDPCVLKGILGRAHLVISSRFHALVSALSQAVPCLATGWSHKYDALLADYGCPEWVVPVNLPGDELACSIRRLTEEPSRSEIVARLSAAAERQRRLAEAMWREVDSVLEIAAC